MTFIPVFQIGIWNAWLFMLYVIFYNILPYLLSLLRPIYRDILEKGTGPDIQLNKTEVIMAKIMFFVFIVPIVYSFFLPIKIFTIWFYIGLFIYLVGVVIGTMAMYDFYTTAVDDIVIKGIYRISRNPMYLGILLIYIGTGIASTSWVFLLFTIIFMILSHKLVIIEERFCLKKYGKKYHEYINRTPRWFGIPKSKPQE